MSPSNVTRVKHASLARRMDEHRHSGWTLAEHVDDDQFAHLRERAATRLGRFVAADGRVRFAVPALIATATRP